MKVDGRWVPTFPNARYLLGRPEFEHCDRRMAEVDDGRSFHPGVFLDDSIRPILDAGLVDLVEPDHRICGEVRLIPTFGHTPGHVSVVIASAGEEALITGDTIHHPSQIRHPDWFIRADFDVGQAIATRRNLLEETVDTGRLVIGTHWAGRSSGRIVREEGGYRLER
jgi:glyoxylase-like metal-dependent hydrolase (beta-lactamase superfamily II)